MSAVELAAAKVGAEELLARVEGIAHLVSGSADQAERERRLPPAVLDALHDAGLFRMLLPSVYGGLEVDPPCFMQVIEAVARLDASTAWCLGQANGCTMSAAYLDAAVAEQIWGRDPRAVVAWGPGREAVARLEGDRYRASGTWSFASGSRHATWLGGHCAILDEDGTPRRAASGEPEMRTMLFPAGEAEMIDMWDVLGLRATASDGFTVTDLAVPAAFAVSRDDPAERRLGAPLYQFTAMNLYATGFCAVALGIARAMLEEFRVLAAGKTPRLARRALADNGAVQFEYAHADARLRAARALLLSDLIEIWDEVVTAGEVTDAQRMRIRINATHGIHEAKAAADAVYDHAGASAIFASSPFERRFRDLHTVAQQLQGRRDHYRSAGAFAFGHPADPAII